MLHAMAQASLSTLAGVDSGGEDSHLSENYFQRWLVDPAHGNLAAGLTKCLQGIKTSVVLASSQLDMEKHIQKEGKRLTGVQQMQLVHAFVQFKTQLQGVAAGAQFKIQLQGVPPQDLKVEGIKGGRTNEAGTAFSFRCKILENGKNRSITAKWCAIRLRTLRLRA